MTTLKLLNIDSNVTDVSWTVDNPTPGVVIFDLLATGENIPAALHWRAGTWEKPPLDVMLDSHGHLIGLQFGLQDERVVFGEGATYGKPEIGIPQFDVSSWPSNRYRDERVSVTACRTNFGNLELRIGDERPLRRVSAPGSSLHLAFDKNDHLALIEIGPLSTGDWLDFAAF